MICYNVMVYFPFIESGAGESEAGEGESNAPVGA